MAINIPQITTIYYQQPEMTTKNIPHHFWHVSTPDFWVSTPGAWHGLQRPSDAGHDDTDGAG
jgi:hypothetical protein